MPQAISRWTIAFEAIVVVVEIHVLSGPIPKGRLRRAAVARCAFIIFARG